MTSDLARARNLDHDAALMVGNILGLRKAQGLAAALLDGVDDFTRGDRSTRTSPGLDLTGVRWSD